jgi:hypothetical protein
MTENIPPTRGSDGFNCPHCGAFAQQAWPRLYQQDGRGSTELGEISRSVCRRCGESAWWVWDQMVFPVFSSSPLAHPDMPESVADDYKEARTVVSLSPRGACALLRLALQKLCVELGESGQNINDDIASLVKKGLLPQIQQSLDVLRVIGNNAVHPGLLDLKDDTDTALALFGAMNVVVEQLISAPKHAEALYSSLPQGAIDAIQRRDNSP